MATQPSEECKNAGAPKPSTYSPKGKFLKLGDLSVYQIGSGKKVVILIYDIFGWNDVNKNVFEFADDLSGLGACTVLMPDFYRGEAWPIDQFPPSSDLQQTAFNTWRKGVAAEVVVRKDLYEKVLPHLHKSKLNDIGVVGFCWGGYQSFLMGADGERFKAVASVHGAWIDDKLCGALQVPVYYAPAKGDTDVKVVKKVLDAKPFGKQCRYDAFADQEHGFCAARGDWKNTATKKAKEKVLKELCDFFNKNLK
mmetsp:Transcript_3509/g.6137  ORF Transcript_3509/g.6137 Transcript_3509/m.6137 type:complete len:252 (-) Transcript_3509:75-830(-)